MSNYSEVGHAKNAANFEDLISYCTGYGITYNPVLNAIKIANMNTLKTSANTSIASVSTNFTTFKNATNSREIVFLPLKKLATRIISALKACGVPAQTVKDANTINHKLQGKRAKPLVVVENNNQNKMIDPNNPPPVDLPKNISVSQQSYDSQIEFFGKLIDLLTATPAYNPNEVDLKLPALNTMLTNMKTTNTAVITATTNFSNTRIARTKLLYLPVTGLVDVAGECKSYVKSVFGATSLEYKQVSKISFKKLK
jgi:hypothetical protein